MQRWAQTRSFDYVFDVMKKSITGSRFPRVKFLPISKTEKELMERKEGSTLIEAQR